MKRIALVSDSHVNPGSAGPRRFDLPISWAFWREDGTIEFNSLP